MNKYKLMRNCKLLKETLIDLRNTSEQDKDFPYLDVLLCVCKMVSFPDRYIAEKISDSIIDSLDDFSQLSDYELKKIIDSVEGDL